MSSATHKLTGIQLANQFWEKSPQTKRRKTTWLHCDYDQFLKFMGEWYSGNVPYIDGNESSYEAFRLRRRIEQN